MAIDSLRGEHLSESLVVVAHDAEGAVRGFLHFAPCYGRAAVSLGLMRRDRDSVNGLTEFLVVSAIEMLRERGIEEMSLNFSAFARLLRDPDNLFERTLGRLVALVPHRVGGDVGRGATALARPPARGPRSNGQVRLEAVDLGSGPAAVLLHASPAAARTGEE